DDRNIFTVTKSPSATNEARWAVVKDCDQGYPDEINNALLGKPQRATAPSALSITKQVGAGGGSYLSSARAGARFAARRACHAGDRHEAHRRHAMDVRTRTGLSCTAWLLLTRRN
ncbi:unnamed protein product, partial [marine sediment metagenome]